jgi:hypothetical protein
MVSILLLVVMLIFSCGKQTTFQLLPDGGLAPYVSFSNNINDAVDLMLITQIWSKNPRNEFFLVAAGDVIKSVLVLQGSEMYEMDSNFALSKQTASVVIFSPNHSSFGLTQADFPANKQIRLRAFLLNRLRLKGYKNCEYQATPASAGITLNFNCSADTVSQA